MQLKHCLEENLQHLTPILTSKKILIVKNLIFHFKKLEKKIKSKVSRRKNIRIKLETNEKTDKQKRKSVKPKNGSLKLEKIIKNHLFQVKIKKNTSYQYPE